MSEEIASPEQPQAPATPPTEPAQEQPVEQQAAPVVDDDAAIEAEAIEIPTGEKLVPLSAVTKLRAELKTVKGQAGKVAELEQKLKETEGNLQAAAPYIHAARAMLQAQQQPQQPAQPEGPTPEETAALEEIARDFDFYKADGSLDLAKAERHQKRTRAEAERIAQAQMQPLVEQNLHSRYQALLGKAMNTEINGVKADPEILKQEFNHIASQPGGLQTLASPEGAKQLYIHALGMSVVKWLNEGKAITPKQAKALAQAQQAAADLPEPLFTEKSGGRAPQPVALDDGDKRLARDLGISQAEYQKMVSEMPAGWGGRR